MTYSIDEQFSGSRALRVSSDSPSFPCSQTLRSALFLFLAILGLCLCSAAQSTPGFLTFDAPGAVVNPSKSPSGTAVTAIDSTGNIAGIFTDGGGSPHAFVRSPIGAFSLIEQPAWPVSGSIPIAFDGAGDLVGMWGDSTKDMYGFIRTAAGAVTSFFVPDAVQTYPMSMDVAGDVAGIFRFGTTGPYYIFVRTAAGSITDRMSTSCSNTKQLLNVTLNPALTVAGTCVDSANVFHGFLISSTGTVTAVGASGAGAGTDQGTAITGLDESGNVVGSYVDSAQVAHGFVRSAAGTFSTFSAPGAGSGAMQGTYPFSYPRGFDSAGDVAGVFIDSNDEVHGFIRTAAGAISAFDPPGQGPASASNWKAPLFAPAARPVIELPSGTYTTPGVTICYTDDGSVPTTNSKKYQGPIQISTTGVIQAMAASGAWGPSQVATKSYHFQLPPTIRPVFSPPGDSYSGTQVVTITSAAQNAMVYYTLNGGTPQTGKNAGPTTSVYTGPITVTDSAMITAVAVQPGAAPSPATTAQYIIGTSNQPMIYTIAGNGSEGYSGDGGPAPLAGINSVSIGMVKDNAATSTSPTPTTV